MDDKQRLSVLEDVLQQMLRPVRNVPFDLVIKALSGHKVIKTDLSDAADATMLAELTAAVLQAGAAIHRAPIRRPRPNEVGNDAEAFVLRALIARGLAASRPTSADGRGKATGYPDILFMDAEGRPTYLECKIFAADSVPSTMRSFYLSPSESFKVSMDARHLLLAFAMETSPVPNSRSSDYRPVGFKIVDLHDLLCDVKYEFNSDNRRLYAEGLVLAEGSIAAPGD